MIFQLIMEFNRKMKMINVIIEIMRRKRGNIKALMMVTIAIIGLTLSCGDGNDKGNESDNGNGGMSIPYISDEFINVGNFGGIREFSPKGLAAIGSTLYMVGDRNDALYTLDTTTGAVTRVGSATDFGVSQRFPEGLVAIGSILYMVGGDSKDALYTLDTTTGVATRVGSANQFGVGERLPGGLAAIGSTLYMVGDRTDTLYKSVVMP